MALSVAEVKWLYGRKTPNQPRWKSSTFKQQIAKHDTFFPQIMHWSFLPSNSKTIDYIKSNFTVGLWRQFKDKIKLGKQNHSFWSCHYFRMKAKNLLVKCFKPKCTIARFALIIYIKPFSLASGGNSRSIVDSANKSRPFAVAHISACELATFSLETLNILACENWKSAIERFVINYLPWKWFLAATSRLFLPNLGKIIASLFRIVTIFWQGVPACILKLNWGNLTMSK